MLSTSTLEAASGFSIAATTTIIRPVQTENAINSSLAVYTNHLEYGTVTIAMASRPSSQLETGCGYYGQGK
jgi:hypothetical protein